MFARLFAVPAMVGAGLLVAHLNSSSAQAPAAPQAAPQAVRVQASASSPAAPIAPSAHQQLAELVAQRLQQSGQLRCFQIDVNVHHGLVDLIGQVTDEGQRDLAVRIAQSVPGVQRVREQLTFRNPVKLAQATAGDKPSLQEPAPLLRKDLDAPVGPNVRPPEPTPIFQAPPPGVPGAPGGMQQAPPLPPYAWPTYAAYNNYSRVGYPTVYPYQSWPFIGPMHPFPKVPLGWRSITLEHFDGHWWYGRNSTGHDFWRIRYW
jgi:hypothetical protein